MCCVIVVDPCPCCWELLRESSPAKKNNIKTVLLERKMAAALLRTGRLSSVKCLLADRWITWRITPAAVALGTKSGGSKKSSKKNSSDKDQTKTYFDVEKLIQHKSYEFAKERTAAPASAQAAVSQVAESTPAAASRTVSATHVVEAPAPKVEASPGVESLSPVKTLTSETASAVEDQPFIAAEPVPAAKVVARAVPAAEVVAGAVPVAEVVAEAVPASVPGAAPPAAKAPVAETGSVESAAALEVTPAEPADKVPVEATPEPSATEAALVEANAAPVEAEAAAEVSTPVGRSEELVDPAQVTAEAAGEELQADGPVEPSEDPGEMDPIQKLFLNSIREYSTKSQAAGGLVDAGSDYEKALAEEVAKLQRLYGGGDLASFPQFKFTDPKLDEVAQK